MLAIVLCSCSGVRASGGAVRLGRLVLGDIIDKSLRRGLVLSDGSLGLLHAPHPRVLAHCLVMLLAQLPVVRRGSRVAPVDPNEGARPDNWPPGLCNGCWPRPSPAMCHAAALGYRGLGGTVRWPKTRRRSRGAGRAWRHRGDR
jgi:hypothetical protein